MKIVIYGAQAIALGTFKALRTLFPQKEVECFLVTKLENNARELGGLPVKTLIEFSKAKSDEEKNEYEVYICTPENVMSEIEISLKEEKIQNYVRVTSIRWANMMNSAFIKDGEFTPLSVYPITHTEAKLNVYKMKHKLDKQLKSSCEEYRFVKSVQVGTDFSGKIQADFYDNEGDNISSKNKNFSELTGLYWVWKNKICKSENDNSYFGLVHYRRLFDLSEDDLLRLNNDEIEVLLPYPMPYEPNIEAHHERYLSHVEWDSVLQALRELQPEYLGVAKEILEKQYMYNYNIILARRNVLDEYCSWLFPILFRIEEINSPRCMEEPNRFIGYIAESLETIYFMHNKQQYNIVHTGCKFLL